MDRREFLISLVAAAAAASVSGVAPNAVAAAEIEPLYLLTYDHCGVILYGHERFAAMVRDAVAWLDRHPNFKVGLDNEAWAYDYLAEKQPALLEEFRGYLKKYPGRFGIGTSTYGQPLSQFINDESNIRQISYALEANRRHFGVTNRIYLMSEHAMHSQIPQILAGFGFQGAIMRTHFMMYGYNPQFNVPIGWWVGRDGSRVATIPTYKEEGAKFGGITDDNNILTRCPGPGQESPGQTLEKFRAKFSSIHPLLATRADDANLRKEGLVTYIDGKPRDYQWILLEELLKLFPPPKEEMVTAPNDFKVRMPWGYCGNEIWDGCRRAEVAVLTAERMAAVAHLLGAPHQEAELKTAWKNLLVTQHHDVQICGLLKDSRTYLPLSLDASRGVRETALKYVAGRMTGGKSAQLTVFNPLSWRRPEWVEAEAALPAGMKEVQVTHGGKAVPNVLLEEKRREDGLIEKARLAILADAPPVGFASYAVVAGASAGAGDKGEIKGCKVDGLKIENAYWAIELDPRGGIAALKDAKTGRDVFVSGKRSGFFAGVIDGKECESQGTWSIMPGPAAAPWVTAREKGTISGIPYVFDMTVRADSPRIDLKATFQFNNQKIGQTSNDKKDARSPFVHEKKLRLKLFPALGGEATGVRDLPFVIEPTADRYVEGNYWTAVADGKAGLAVFNRGTMGSVREADGGFSVPLAYSMYYVWGTRMLSGEFSYELALYPFAGDWKTADVHRKALEYSFPCPITSSAPGDGKLGETARVIEVKAPNEEEQEKEGVILSAFYTEGGTAFARLFAHRGEKASARMKVTDTVKGPVALTEVDLAGNRIGTVSGAGVMEFGPCKFKTVRMDLEGG